MNIIEIILVKADKGKVKARADIVFDWFTLKGFKVIQNDEGKIYVTPPSYNVGMFWRPLFKTESEEDWKEIQRQVIDKFDKQEIEESLGVRVS
jgi:DNA-binding cell septation regulator SpoVG